MAKRVRSNMAKCACGHALYGHDDTGCHLLVKPYPRAPIATWTPCACTEFKSRFVVS